MQTPEGVTQAARETLGYRQVNERRRRRRTARPAGGPARRVAVRAGRADHPAPAPAPPPPSRNRPGAESSAPTSLATVRSRVAGVALVVALGSGVVGGLRRVGRRGGVADAQVYVAAIRDVLADAAAAGRSRRAARRLRRRGRRDGDPGRRPGRGRRRARRRRRDPLRRPARGSDARGRGARAGPRRGRPRRRRRAAADESRHRDHRHVEVYRSEDDSSKVVLTIARRSSQWTVTSLVGRPDRLLIRSGRVRRRRRVVGAVAQAPARRPRPGDVAGAPRRVEAADERAPRTSSPTRPRGCRAATSTAPRPAGRRGARRLTASASTPGRPGQVDDAGELGDGEAVEVAAVPLDGVVDAPAGDLERIERVLGVGRLARRAGR